MRLSGRAVGRAGRLDSMPAPPDDHIARASQNVPNAVGLSVGDAERRSLRGLLAVFIAIRVVHLFQGALCLLHLHWRDLFLLFLSRRSVF